MSFVERYGLWTDAQRAAARALAGGIEGRGVEVVRFSFPDQHGILRGKTVTLADLPRALAEGVSFTTTLFAKDTSHRSVFPVFTRGGGFGLDAMEGGADALMIADPTTFRVLPWAPHTGWLLCDPYFPSGQPVPFATRELCRRALARLAESGFDYVAGLEIEFHVFKLVDPRLAPEHAGQPGEPPEVSLLSHGYQYLTEQRYDLIDPVVEILRRDLAALGLPLRSLEVEFGPSQVEFTLGALAGLGVRRCDGAVPQRGEADLPAARLPRHVHVPSPDPARDVERLAPAPVAAAGRRRRECVHAGGGRRSAVRDGPALPRGAARARARRGRTVHPDDQRLQALSPVLARARPRRSGARDNRGAMLRVIGGAGDPATRIENRIGEPAANPYLYFASQIHSGLDGTAARARPRALRRYAVRSGSPTARRVRWTKRWQRCVPTHACAKAWAARSWTTSAASRRRSSRASTSK